MDALELEALARRHIEVENAGDLDAVMRTVSQGEVDYHVVCSGERYRSVDEVRAHYRDFLAALPDMKITAEDLLVDPRRRRVLVQYRLTGTLRGWYWGLAPNGRQMAMVGAIIYEFDESGTLVRETSYFDKTEIFSSLGLIRSTKTPLGVFLLIFWQSPLYALRCAWAALRSRLQGWWPPGRPNPSR